MLGLIDYSTTIFANFAIVARHKRGSSFIICIAFNLFK